MLSSMLPPPAGAAQLGRIATDISAMSPGAHPRTSARDSLSASMAWPHKAAPYRYPRRLIATRLRTTAELRSISAPPVHGAAGCRVTIGASPIYVPVKIASMRGGPGAGISIKAGSSKRSAIDGGLRRMCWPPQLESLASVRPDRPIGSAPILPNRVSFRRHRRLTQSEEFTCRTNRSTSCRNCSLLECFRMHQTERRRQAEPLAHSSNLSPTMSCAHGISETTS